MNLFSDVVGTERPRDQLRVTQYHHGRYRRQAGQAGGILPGMGGHIWVPSLALPESEGILADCV